VNSYMQKMWSLTAAGILALSVVAMWVWPKVFGGGVHPIMGWAELQSGAEWLYPVGRWGFGILAAITVVLLLISRTRMIGGWAALALSLTYVVLHSTPWLGWNIPEYGPLGEALAAGRSLAEIQAMNLGTDYGAHGTLTLVLAVLAGMVILAERTLRQPKPPKQTSVNLASID
jgi:hypothetical protein